MVTSDTRLGKHSGRIPIRSEQPCPCSLRRAVPLMCELWRKKRKTQTCPCEIHSTKGPIINSVIFSVCYLSRLFVRHSLFATPLKGANGVRPISQQHHSMMRVADFRTQPTDTHFSLTSIMSYVLLPEPGSAGNNWKFKVGEHRFS